MGKRRGDSGEGILGGSESYFSFWCPIEGKRLASLAKLDHGVERLKKQKTGNETVIMIHHPQEFLELALCKRFGEPPNGLTL